MSHLLLSGPSRQGALSLPALLFRSEPFLPMLQQPTPPHPTPPLHTTSDLLRLLAADAHPFASVAEAVAARFGGGLESRDWLARTLVTLLRVSGLSTPGVCSCGHAWQFCQGMPVVRVAAGTPPRQPAPAWHPAAASPPPHSLPSTQDGLLYTEAEKLNAAYLLRFVALGGAGAHEALLQLTLPDSGQPPAVRAWAVALAQLGSNGDGSAGSSPVASPSWQAQQQGGALPASAALVHQRTPRQVLAEAAAPVDGQVQFCSLPLGQPPPLLPWQGTALSAAAAAPPPSFPSSPAVRPAVPPWMHQPASPMQYAQQQHHYPASPMQLGQLQQQHPASPMQLGQQPPQVMVPPLAQPLPPPLSPQPASPLSPHQPASPLSPPQLRLPPAQMQMPPSPPVGAQAAAAAAAQHAQWQQAQQERQQREQLAGLQSLLQQAAQAPLVPAMQLRLVQALQSPLGAPLTAPLAATVNSNSSSGSSSGPTLQPRHMRGLVEQNCPVATQVGGPGPDRQAGGGGRWAGRPVQEAVSSSTRPGGLAGAGWASRQTRQAGVALSQAGGHVGRGHTVTCLCHAAVAGRAVAPACSPCPGPVGALLLCCTAARPHSTVPLSMPLLSFRSCCCACWSTTPRPQPCMQPQWQSCPCQLKAWSACQQW